ncbi:MAG: hypothetical protein A3H32_08405 [Betaproteobacteria bacterium RIFCSPLOWO2_02_FULL_63_19]|nr:MAG: hypothetical protein A3H32_08405 [Betaproteobacteria bacterium RIFCSPLOWO2_02_FULL_63_19]
MSLRILLVISCVFSAAAIAADGMPAGHPPIGAKAQAPRGQLPQKGKVVSVIDVPQYTYLEVAQGKKISWIAAPRVTAKKGDIIRFDNGMPMGEFHSKTLNRDFANISFVSRVVVTKEKE